MLTGRYDDDGPPGLERFTAPRFRPCLLDSLADRVHFVTTHGCGRSAFKMLTGNLPNPRFGKLTTGSDMTKALREAGCIVEPLTYARVSDGHAGQIENVVGKHHVLLISSLMFRGTGSWQLLHRHRFYHNFEYVKNLPALEFINRPTLQVFVVFKPEWGPSRTSWLNECSRPCRHLGVSKYLWTDRMLEFNIGPNMFAVIPNQYRVSVDMFKQKRGRQGLFYNKTEYFKWTDFERRPRKVARRILQMVKHNGH